MKASVFDRLWYAVHLGLDILFSADFSIIPAPASSKNHVTPPCAQILEDTLPHPTPSIDDYDAERWQLLEQRTGIPFEAHIAHDLINLEDQYGCRFSTRPVLEEATEVEKRLTYLKYLIDTGRVSETC